MEKVIVIKVDDILRGYNDHNKLPKIYSRIRKEVLKSKPIQTSPRGLVVIEDSFRRGSYECEIYNVDWSDVVIEARGSWNGYAPISQQTKIKLGPNQKNHFYFWSRLKITLHNKAQKHKKSIENIIADFPREAVKEAQLVDECIVK